MNPACATSLSSKQSMSTRPVSSGRGLVQPFGRQRVLCTRAMSDANKLLRKPELVRPELPQKKLFDEPQQPAAVSAQPAPTHAAPAAAAPAAEPTSAGAVTIEWQRQRAKEMRKYFQDSQLTARAQKSQIFGWTPANEIGNGRWVMFGVFVGLLTEYATGVNFPDQIGLLVNYLGIVDIE